MSKRWVLASVAAAIAVGCGESTGPRARAATDVLLGQAVTAQLAPGDTALYRFAPSAAIAVALQVLVTQGKVSVAVSDSTGAGLVPPLSALGPDTAWRCTAYAHPAAGTAILIRAAADRDGASFQLRVTGVQSGPETHSAALLADDTVYEAVDDRGDIDVFEFAPQPNTEYVLFVQGLSSDVWPEVDLMRSDFPEWRDAPIELGPADFEANRHYLPSYPVHTWITVSGWIMASRTVPPGIVSVPYRLVAKKINHNPERVSRVLVPGDTVSGEAIDHVGDVDEFLFSAGADEQFNLFLQSQSTSPGTYFNADLIPGTVAVQNLLFGVTPDTNFLARASGRFTPGAGTFRIRITAPDTGDNLPRGPYRFQLFKVNRALEDLPASTFALGGGLAGERIFPIGDVDEFTMTVPADTFGAVYLWRPSSTIGTADASKALLLTVVDLRSGRQIADASLNPPTPSDSATRTGMLRLVAGSYLVRVEGASSTGGGFAGPYGVSSGAFDTLPETRSPAMAVGDTAVEALSPPGDEDHYWFRGIKNQMIRVCLQYTGAASEGGLAVSVRSPLPQWAYLGATSAAGPTGSQCDNHTTRITLPADTTYTLAVYGGSLTRLPQHPGQYRLAVLPYPAAPETAPTAVALGDSVTTERIDTANDVDEFVLTAPPGAEFQTWILNRSEGFLDLDALNAATLESLRSTSSSQSVAALGRVTVPAEGQVRLRFYNPCSWTCLGPYSFWVRAINRAPESVPAAIAVGDTVSGESLGYEGDIDEFTFTGAAGDTVRAYLQFPVTCYPGARLDVVAPDGSILGTVSGWNYSPTLESLTTGRFRLPVTGSYTVRVYGNDDREGTGAYRFQIAR